MFENFKTFETTYAGRPVVVETGKTCGLANGSCWVRYGETVVMANVTASAKPREGVDFFPLSVDFEEKMYAVGRIPGSFTKREGKASDKAILASRCVDRPIRPLFPKDMRNDVSVVMTVLSVDPDNSPEITGMIATSIALSISDIPWNGPVASINVGYVDGELVLNPTLEQRAKNRLNLTVAGSAEKIVMIEAGADQIPDDLMLKAIMTGHEEIKKMVAFINDIKAQIGKPKFEFESMEVDHDLFDAVEAMVGEQVKVALDTDDKNVRDARLQPIIDAVHEKFDEQCEDNTAVLDEVMYKLQKKIVRNWLYEGKRVDGRGIDDAALALALLLLGLGGLVGALRSGRGICGRSAALCGLGSGLRGLCLLRLGLLCLRGHGEHLLQRSDLVLLRYRIEHDVQLLVRQHLRVAARLLKIFSNDLRNILRRHAKVSGDLLHAVFHKTHILATS